MPVIAVCVALMLAGQAEKVEEVSFDDLEKEDARESGTMAGTRTTQREAASAQPEGTGSAQLQGNVKVEEVETADLAASAPTTEYERRPWLRALPFVALLIMVWNVDWREMRVRAEIAARRSKKLAPVRKKES